MPQIFFIRHGQAAGGPSRTDHDFNLTEKGQAQARATAEVLFGMEVRPRLIYASRLTRARQTAEILRERLNGPPPLVRSDLIEHGSHPLLCSSIEEAVLKFPEAVTPDGQLINGGTGADGQGLTDDFSVGGETLLALHQRAANAWLDIRTEIADQEGDVLVVAHGSFLAALMTELLGMPRRSVWGTAFPNAGFVQICLYKNARTGEIEPVLQAYYQP